MTYKETLDWMYAQLPMYQRVGASALRPKLDNIRALCEYLGNPQEHLKTIHIAGTNGKGSTSHMIASVLQEAGYKVGLYTSPHLKDFRERIRINGNLIEEDDVVHFITAHKKYMESLGLSFFEMTVGLAFDVFSREKVDYAVIEVGLGGRLDSTNIIHPLLSVITNIGWDHKEILGDTLAKIAGEKAGIIKPLTPVIIGEFHPETFPVFENKAKEMQAPLYQAWELEHDFSTDLKGFYQQKNIKTALCALNVLNDPALTPGVIRRGLSEVVANTGLMGRWQVLGSDPLIVADTAHNKDGLEQVMRQVNSISCNQVHMVIGFVKDKELDGILPYFPVSAKYYFCCPQVPRGLNANDLQRKAVEFGLIGEVFPSVSDALKAARESASDRDFIYVGGSTFVVAEIV